MKQYPWNIAFPISVLESLVITVSLQKLGPVYMRGRMSFIPGSKSSKTNNILFTWAVSSRNAGMKMISSHPAREEFHLARDELHPASAFGFFVCCSNKMARKQLILTFAAIEISLCLVSVLLQLLSVLLFQVFNQHRQRKSLLRALITEKNIALRRQRYLRLRAVRRRRKNWKKLGKTSLWWDRLLNGEMDESERKLNLRLSKKEFMELVHRLRPHLAPKSWSFRPDSSTVEKTTRNDSSLLYPQTPLECHQASLIVSALLWTCAQSVYAATQKLRGSRTYRFLPGWKKMGVYIKLSSWENCSHGNFHPGL